ncbi:hypothetical protein AB0C29_39120, partial [Actinoplanes sp. NPDC048791]|uniref:hypothetical protein n=1 Tax=Actinoplanes sp. NPDC048791 TaxID=3154623 RepID=UPI0033E9ECA6
MPCAAASSAGPAARDMPGDGGLTALSDRIKAFLTGDREAVTSEQALADAHLVVRALHDRTVAPAEVGRALYLVASLHWSRYLVLPPGEREPEYLVAKQFFGYIATASPERVPRPLWPELGLEPSGDTDDGEARIAALARSGAALAARFRHRPQPGDAEAAVTAYREAVALARAANDPQTPVLVANLAGSLLLRGFADLAVLDEIISMIDEALPGADERGTDVLLSNLAIALRQRFQLRQQHDDLLRAADACERRARLQRGAGSARANALATLAAVLGTLFEVDGRPEDLTAAVAAAREAVAARDPDRMSRAGHLTNLGNLLRIRYEHYRSRDDLDEAVAVCAEALALAPDRRQVAAMWSNSSAALRERFRLARDPADLTAAIDAARHGVDAAPPGDPYFAPNAIHLGCALLDRHFLAGPGEGGQLGGEAPADVREAVRMLRAALEELPPEHRFRGPASVNLGVGLRTLFEGTGDRAALDAAVLAGRAGHLSVRDDDPSRALDALNLAQSLRARVGAAGGGRDARGAAARLRGAGGAGTAPARG